MTGDLKFLIEPWHVRELGFDLDQLAQSESIFALSNGHIGVRGNLDEGDPAGLPGSYLNSFYESRPLPYAEAGYGYPESGQTIVNVTNGKIIRLLVDDQPLDLRYGTVLHQERTLDMRTGLLHRELIWETPSRRKIKLTSTRLVSFTQRSILAIDFKVEALERAMRVVIQSELVANEELPIASDDPRVAAALTKPLKERDHSTNGRTRSMLIHRTKASKLQMAAAVDHLVHGDAASNAGIHTYGEQDWMRTTIGTHLGPGESIGVTKFVAYGWSSQRSLPSLRDQVDGSLSSAINTGWGGLVKEQREYVEEFWDGADVEVEGDPALQQAVRFGLWHTLQAGARAEGRAIPAKGLTGPGYDGHAFWDTESFVLPVLSATAPEAAHDALLWRHSILELARERAATLHFHGAAFPWRTIRGQECSAYWPAGTGAFHINAAVALAAARYVFWTEDELFDRTVALPLLVETARLWLDVGYFGDDGKFHIDGVTGPDEYTAVVADNIYTNLAAARNMRYAADVCERWPEAASELEVADEEIAMWRAADDQIAVPFDEERQVHQQNRGSTDREVWDFQATHDADRYPLLLNYPYFDIYRKQVVKQADLMLAMHWFGDVFTPEQKARAFDYYERITVRDSSLSACTQAVIAAEVGQLDLAYDYACEAGLMDLRDLEKNTKDGVHIASLAGAWMALVCGFGGMRDHDGNLSFAPSLPDQLSLLHFSVRWQGDKIRVHITHDHVTYTLDGGRDGYAKISHCGEEIGLHVGEPVSRPIQRVKPLLPRPPQPVGRAPISVE